jgi:hypothetical protein
MLNGFFIGFLRWKDFGSEIYVGYDDPVVTGANGAATTGRDHCY